MEDAKDVYSSSSDYTMVFIDTVIVRPSMYTSSGSLEEVGAFLQAFHLALGTYNSRQAAQTEALHWFHFCQWACQQVAEKRGDWRQLFATLRQIYSLGEQALAQLALLHIAFRNNQKDQGSSLRMFDIFKLHDDMLLKDILLHPQEYIINGTIEEIVSFLEGYYSGKYAHRPNTGNEVSWWPDFCRWAMFKILPEGEHKEARPHHDLFLVLRERYGDDTTIRKVVLQLIDDYE